MRRRLLHRIALVRLILRKDRMMEMKTQRACKMRKLICGTLLRIKELTRIHI